MINLYYSCGNKIYNTNFFPNDVGILSVPQKWASNNDSEDNDGNNNENEHDGHEGGADAA